MIRVVLVDDHPGWLKGFEALFAFEPDLVVVGTARNGQDALVVAQQTQPDVVLLDVRMPGMDGITATRRLQHTMPGVKIVLFTQIDEDEDVLEGLHAGAMGYILKDADPDAVVAAIRTVARGDVALDPTIAKTVVRGLQRVPREDMSLDRAMPILSGREHEVLVLLAHNAAYDEIAARLHLSVATVSSHVAHIRAKLGGAPNRAAAVAEARRWGLLPPILDDMILATSSTNVDN